MKSIKAPWVLAYSKLRYNFQLQPPCLVRWGFHCSPIGALLIGITAEGFLCRIAFAQDRKATDLLYAWQKSWPKTEFVQDDAATAKMVKNMFGGGGELTLQMTGTKFQHSVWKVLTKIPTGKTLSYADVARSIKNPKAVRAVGTACGANPLAILVPCHRVIATNGALGGFGGGLRLKRVMLEAEHAA